MLSSQPRHKGPSDEHLMQLMAKGERWAFELLYERYFDKLVWFARGFLEDEQKAEDVVQEVFIRIIESPGKFDSEKRWSTWIYTTTGNACKNILRNEQNRHRILQEKIAPVYAEEVGIQDQTDHNILKASIRMACKELNEKEKNIFTLRFEHDLSIKEIAAIAGMPEGSVKSTIYYLLRKLAPHLKDFTPEKEN